MPSLKDIRIRISSVQNTQQITRAMKMVSAAKLRRAQTAIVNMRPYAKNLLKVIADIAHSQRVVHPLLTARGEPKKVLLVVLTSDRGLCGGFNSNINRFAEKYYNEKRSSLEVMDFIFIGRKAVDYFKRRGIEPLDTILNLARENSYSLASGIAESLIEYFLKGQYDEIRLVYNEFKSAISQNVTVETLLPVNISDSHFVTSEERFSPDMIFEPEPEVIIDDLLKRHFSIQVFRCMSESVAAEHGARMNSMENATKNASEMIRNLTLTYNKLRQASITTELIEITSGAEALRG